MIGGTCGGCGLPGHRFGTTDPSHDYSATACVNSLRGKVEELDAHLSAALCALQDIEGECRSRRNTTLTVAVLAVIAAHAEAPTEYGVIGSAHRPTGGQIEGRNG